MVDNSHIAAALLQIQAVKIQPKAPFTWSSGWKSPIYCDNRLTLSYPDIRTMIRDEFVSLIRREFPEVTGIAGVATGAIANGVLVAEAMGLPFIYIRSAAKGHGMGNLIEGKVDPKGKYVIIEDLISTGGSSVKAVKAVQETGATVLVTLSIFSYGFPQATKAYAETGTKYIPLTNLQELLQKAEENNYLQPQEKETIYAWQQDPANWKSD
ncbi:MAG: orotate phosphoribosyltransferase [Bacteroidetes bacterium]|nr:orotate phosphoribosyltransferase [Bacteroidota bacterium]